MIRNLNPPEHKLSIQIIIIPKHESLAALPTSPMLLRERCLGLAYIFFTIKFKFLEFQFKANFKQFNLVCEIFELKK